MSTETTAGAARYRATGKRKSAVARVTLTPGSGEITCNGRPIDEFFGRKVLVTEARQPLAVTGTEGRFDVVALLHGGGVSGQAGALRLGIARALVEFNLELRQRLKKAGFLTRDARIKERKKYGQKGARKRFQFSKR
jgi:small subunit ribosomal protein S9